MRPGMYNTTEMELHWEEGNPVILDQALRLTEYSLAAFSANESCKSYDYVPETGEDDMGMDRFGEY